MKKVEKKVAEPKTEQKELKEAFALWSRKGQSGLEYYTGKCDDISLLAFVNTNKKNEKEPDIRVYTSDENNDDKLVEVASLWKNVSKKDKLYLAGTDNEDEKLVGFYNDKFMEFPNRPYIRVYYKEQETK